MRSVDRARLEGAPFAVLATHGPGGRIDLVPCCFAVDDEGRAGPEVVTAVDHKPKSTTELARLANVRAIPQASLLVDHRDPDDWSQLWWVRVSGPALVVESGPDHERAIDRLVEKYDQYRQRPPAGPVIRITVERSRSWSAR